jgi:tRNA G18 (ribose-2'-O)-methylase SpoU
MNVIDKLKDLSVDDIKNYCDNSSIDSSIAMINIEGDFNFGTLVRNANFFGYKKCLHVAATKKWDKRSAVGTYKYTNIEHIPSEMQFIEKYKYSHTIIGVENNIPEYQYKTFDLYTIRNPFENPIFVFGSENNGLSNFVLNNCDTIITLPCYGSVRSLNVGTTSGIIMSYYRNLIEIYQ